MNIDSAKLENVMKLIDKITDIIDDAKIKKLESQLREITGKTDINLADISEITAEILADRKKH